MATKHSMTDEGPSRLSVAVLMALQSRRHLYGGTVDPAVVARRRAANKAALRSRRINRRTK